MVIFEGSKEMLLKEISFEILRRQENDVNVSPKIFIVMLLFDRNAQTLKTAGCCPLSNRISSQRIIAICYDEHVHKLNSNISKANVVIFF